MKNCSFKDIISSIKYMFLNWWLWNKFSVVFCGIRVIATISLTILYSLLPKIIIDCISKPVTTNEFIIIIIFFASTIALVAIVCTVSKEKVTIAADYTRMQYRIIALKKIMCTDYENIESLTGRLHFEKGKDFAFRGRWSGSQDFYEIIVQIFISILGVFSYFIFVSFINPMVLVLLLVSCIIEFIIMRKLSKLEIENRNYIIPIYLKFDYLFRTTISSKGIKDIKVNQAESWLKNIIYELTNKCIVFMKKISTQMITTSILRGGISFFREAIAYTVLIYSVVKKTIDLSDFIFYFGIISGFSSWIINMTNQLNSLERACYQCKEFRAFLDLPEKSNKVHANTKLISPCEIEFRNVSFKYDTNKAPILKNINFKINKGEKIAIVGENGAGKTTLMKLLCGLYSPTEGKILINNIDISTISKDKYYDLFSAVFQDYVFFPTSIKTNITLSENNDEFSLEKLEKVLSQVGLLDKIKKLPFSLDTNMIKKINKDGVQFSGGEQQRLLLARALYKNAPILILDEPTASLDPIAEDRLYKQYATLMKDRTSFFISHRIASTQFCDRIFFMGKGEIKEIGNHNELLDKKGYYWKMYKTQSCYYNQ